MKRTNATVSKDLLDAFGLISREMAVPFGGGHINDTFLVDTESGQYILQRINKYVFPSPENIMENIMGVTEFIRKKVLARGGDPDRAALNIVKTAGGQNYFIDENGEYWRCVTFISGTMAHEVVTGPAMLTEAGYAFGDFQNLLSDYPAETLHEIIKDFHNTAVRYQQLMDAAAGNKANRLQDVKAELSFASAREEDCRYLMEGLAENRLPLRVTHNDTKMSNVLIDCETDKAICVIDLDTVMPGLTAFDFGDSIRAGASTAAEDETDLSKVNFSLELFEAYTKGFLKAAGDTLTEEELISLPIGSKLMTLEVGMRFLADYLNGDVYFKTKYPSHNLDRARNQFKLVQDMERDMEKMNDIVLKYTRKYAGRYAGKINGGRYS